MVMQKLSHTFCLMLWIWILAGNIWMTEICSRNVFSCEDGRCVSNVSRCNGINDCEDGTDEQNCTKTWDEQKFFCNDSSSILSSWRCDGVSDCLDRSDEENCRECKIDEFECDNNTKCIDKRWKCDGDFDCNDRTDETSNCTCEPFIEFKCVTSGKCIRKSWQCDGETDCPDRSDEGRHCKNTCRNDQFMCGNHLCISDSLVCDGNVDCLEGSDERNCESPQERFCERNEINLTIAILSVICTLLLEIMAALVVYVIRLRRRNEISKQPDDPARAMQLQELETLLNQRKINESEANAAVLFS